MTQRKPRTCQSGSGRVRAQLLLMAVFVSGSLAAIIHSAQAQQSGEASVGLDSLRDWNVGSNLFTNWIQWFDSGEEMIFSSVAGHVWSINDVSSGTTPSLVDSSILGGSYRYGVHSSQSGAAAAFSGTDITIVGLQDWSLIDRIDGDRLFFSAILSYSGDTVYYGDTGVVYGRNLSTKKIDTIIVSDAATINSPSAISSDGRFLSILVGSEEFVIYDIWNNREYFSVDRALLQCLFMPEGTSGWVIDLDIRDGVPVNGHRLVDFNTGEVVSVLEPSVPIQSATISKSGRWLFTTFEDSAFVWDAHSGKRLAVVQVHKWLTAVAVSPDEEFVAVGTGFRAEEYGVTLYRLEKESTGLVVAAIEPTDSQLFELGQNVLQRGDPLLIGSKYSGSASIMVTSSDGQLVAIKGPISFRAGQTNVVLGLSSNLASGHYFAVLRGAFQTQVLSFVML